MTVVSGTERRRLAAHPSSVGEGRRFIRDLLATGEQDQLAETAELLVSEVVTNALVHAGTEVQVSARLDRTGLRVEVSDGSPHLPAVRSYTGLTGTGRGLRLLEELVDRWGVDLHDAGKTVWFEIGSPTAPVSGPVSPSTPAALAAEGDRTAVELLNTPLLLHAAWQMQAESLLREYLLSVLDEENGTDQFERHAAATDALALLREQVPFPDLSDDPAALLAATDGQATAGRVVIEVPGGSVPHFHLLHEMLTTAAGLADAGAFLTPPTQPEVQAMRRWLCSEVERQHRGARPSPWDGGAEDAVAPREPAPWDPSLAASTTDAVLAADDTDRILAVSASAVALLGYDDATELVHHRLLEIIPARFRQAHLAGFTLHLFAGRSALIDRRVVVPAVRRDGSEVPVGLTISAHHLSGGRRVFVAHLDADEESLTA